MWNKLWREVEAAHHFTPPLAPEITSEAELAALPAAARAYMKFFGVQPGTPKHWSFTLGWTGRFRLAPDKPWLAIEAVQYDTRDPIARFFHMSARMAHVLPVLARDTYIDGHGRMRARIAGVVPVADGKGYEYDVGELVTWLNDVVLVAPTMLLEPTTQWRDAGERAFEVAIQDGDRAVSARVALDDRGAPIDFETEDRFLDNPDDRKHRLIRARWTSPIDAWEKIAGRPLPTRGRAIWHLASGDFTYAEFALRPSLVAFDVPPRTELRAA